MITGQIIREYGQTLDVESAGKIYNCFARKNIDSIVVGDFVVFEWNEATEQGVITERLPRQNVLCRADRYHPIKEMAANLGQIVVMFAPLPEPNEFYLDEYLVAAELMRVSVLLVLNKIDLLSENSMLPELVARYQKIGYQVIAMSAKTGEGLQNLLAELKGKTSFLLGSSGVGKSSLINTLFGKEVTRVLQVSAANQKGQHTTSRSTLYHLKTGGSIIDVPGIRELQLPQAEKEHIAEGFPEFRPYLGHCRFRNCSHQNDPGCLLVEKMQEGVISEVRLKNYYRMLSASIS